MSATTSLLGGPAFPQTRLRLPRHLDLFGSRDEVCRALNELARLALVQQIPVLLEFDDVVSVKGSGLLALAAVIQTARHLQGADHVNGTYPRDKNVERALQDAGFFRLLEIDHRRAGHGPTPWVEHITGNQTDGAQVELLKERVFGCDAGLKPASLGLIYIGLTEAMTNVIQHAYSMSDLARPRVLFVENRWWITGNVDRSRRVFTFSICDLGIGIPKTIGAKLNVRDVLRFLQYNNVKKVDDADLLRFALLVGESSTDLPWRGRGLPQMRQVVDLIGGRIRICSGHATAQYSSSGIITEPHDIPHVGTTIEWTVPLDHVLERHDR